MWDEHLNKLQVQNHYIYLSILGNLIRWGWEIKEVQMNKVFES